MNHFQNYSFIYSIFKSKISVITLIILNFLFLSFANAQVLQAEAKGFQFRAMSGYTTNFVGSEDYRKVEMTQSNFIFDYGFSNDQQIILNASILIDHNPDYDEEINRLNDTVLTYRKLLVRKSSIFRNIFGRVSAIIPTSEDSQQDEALYAGAVAGLSTVIPMGGRFFLQPDISLRQNFHKYTTDGSGEQNINYSYSGDFGAGYSFTDLDTFIGGVATATAFDYENDLMDTELARYIGYNRTFSSINTDLLLLVQEGSALVLNRNGNVKDFDFYSPDTASITLRGTIRF
ncbi:hypothetical protein N9N67_05980 [Bacteriovoracaceae bacterium]|nr:hypothetical protein [Bacteriovoracaceae bacterium]